MSVLELTGEKKLPPSVVPSFPPPQQTHLFSNQWQKRWKHQLAFRANIYHVASFTSGSSTRHTYTHTLNTTANKQQQKRNSTIFKTGKLFEISSKIIQKAGKHRKMLNETNQQGNTITDTMTSPLHSLRWQAHTHQNISTGRCVETRINIHC